MNFVGHAVGGVAAGAAAMLLAGTLASVPGVAEVGGDTLTDMDLLDSGAYLVGSFCTAFLMALFPDLDTASIPQRWYMRVLLLAMLWALWSERMALFTVLALAAPLPMLHKHRGWTHWPITPWLVALALATAHEYVATHDAGILMRLFHRFSWESVGESLLTYWPFVVAAVLGHYTHLLLDGRMLRGLGLFQRKAGHH